ncbi:hypothetical protein AVEN_32746-1 [Araneus ventricosus]|uniref:Uncharacterized protein n=1 Tax=Araneus ventricosus TaxID=182803 RepID=A0A4Y2CVQ7_ARAVE|nr:hypothetical protein AVEN_32746-1 [Araneus ventricosus]
MVVNSLPDTAVSLECLCNTCQYFPDLEEVSDKQLATKKLDVSACLKEEILLPCYYRQENQCIQQENVVNERSRYFEPQLGNGDGTSSSNFHITLSGRHLTSADFKVHHFSWRIYWWNLVSNRNSPISKPPGLRHQAIAVQKLFGILSYNLFQLAREIERYLRDIVRCSECCPIS